MKVLISSKSVKIVVIGISVVGVILGGWALGRHLGIWHRPIYQRDVKIPEITLVVSSPKETSFYHPPKDEMKRIWKGERWVAYQEGLQALAKRLLDCLILADEVVRRHLDLKIERGGAILLRGQQPVGEIITIDSRAEGQGNVMAVFWAPEGLRGSNQTVEEVAEMCQTATHEGVEMTLLISYFLSPKWQDNYRRMRWVGDGLAEYAAYLVAGKFSKSAQKFRLRDHITRIRDLIGLGEEIYNLIDFTYEPFYSPPLSLPPEPHYSPNEMAGYGVSLSFWLSLADQHGEGVIREFLRRLKGIESPTYWNATKILSELAGENIGEAIEKVDLRESLRVLKERLQK